jgi:hypothetical protein
VKGLNDYHFSKEEFAALQSKTKEQRSTYKPINGLQSKEYEELVRSLVASITNDHLDKIQLTLSAPILVRFGTSTDEQYTVTAIRKRVIRLGAKNVGTVKVESTTLLFVNGAILNIHLARELRDDGDVGYVLNTSKVWATNVRNYILQYNP